MDIQTKRVYAQASQQDGFRVLVDRVWPRGMTKEKVQADLWLKVGAPSKDLCKWFENDRTRWDDFKLRYYAELDDQPEVVAGLLDQAGQARLTLLFAARDEEYNQAVALKEYLLAHFKK